MARTTGLLTALYTLALFLFAPLWGHLSDRYGRRIILLIGLTGFGATMLTFAFIENLTAVYVARFLSGLFAAVGFLFEEERWWAATSAFPERNQTGVDRIHALQTITFMPH